VCLWEREEIQEVLPEVKFRLRNRAKKQEPKYGQFWCHSCDAALLHKGAKCPNCGTRDKSKKFKRIRYRECDPEDSEF
jgi:rubrerythrin